MNILADESVDGPIVERLRQEGHSVQYIAEMAPGITDEVVLDLANQERALLLTADKDFGELVFRQGRLSSGVVLIRLAGTSAVQKAEMVVAAIGQHSTEMPRAFSVVSPGIVRIRQRSGS